MVNCTFCGNNVTGKKFCPDCGTPVQMDSSSAGSSSSMCPQCHGAVKPGASFCMHCGTSLLAYSPTPPPPPALRSCPACSASIAGESVFCTQCGHDMRAPAPSQGGIQCAQCGRQNGAGVRFCGGCGAPLVSGAPAQSGQYASAQGYQQPYNPQYQQSSPQYQQSYPQQQYGQGNNQMQPMVGQQQMVLRCPTCMALAPLGSAYCVSCRTSLAGVIPVPMQGQQGQQQGGIGGFLQGNGGKYAVGALGGAAAVLGGEMLLNGVENQVENRVDGDMGYGGYHHHHHHHHRDDENGPLGGLGRLADDIGLI
jgi:hypothetical protein